MAQTVDSLIATLNNLERGELDAILARLEDVRAELAARGWDELVAKLDESRAALRRGEVQEFRRRIATIVSRLGHLR